MIPFRGNERSVTYSAASAISARTCARNSSISVRPFGVSTCQKVQPLQASSPCASAPMRWIEPTVSPSDTAPSARTSRLVPLLGVDQQRAGRNQPALDQRRERHARRLARGDEGRDRRRGHDLTSAMRFSAALAYFASRSMPMKRRPSFLATAPVVPVPLNGSSTRSSGRDADRMTRASSASGFCVGCSFLPSRALQALLAGAEREGPVRAHLHVFVAGFERLVIEGVALGVGVARGPDHGLVRVGEAAAAEIRHRVGLAPDHVVEDPEAEILHDRADAENVVVGADHPDGAGRLQHAAAGGEPAFGEVVVGGEARELVPVVGDRIDVRIVRALQIVGELEIVGRIGEHQIDGAGRQLRHLGDAVADEDAMMRSL